MKKRKTKRIGGGGARKGAGRPRGALSHATREAYEQAKATGETPLQYMLRVMRDENVRNDRRDDMAKSAAPYVHPKRAAITMSGPRGGPVPMITATMSAKEAAELYERTLSFDPFEQPENDAEQGDQE